MVQNRRIVSEFVSRWEVVPVKKIIIVKTERGTGMGSLAASAAPILLILLFVVGMPLLVPAFFSSESVSEGAKLGLGIVLAVGGLSLVAVGVILAVKRVAWEFADVFAACFLTSTVVASSTYFTSFWIIEEHTATSLLPMIGVSVIMGVALFAIPSALAAAILHAALKEGRS